MLEKKTKDLVDYSTLPEHMRLGAKLYVENGIEPGGFMVAVLRNQFVEAFAKADQINSEHIRAWAAWLHNEAPYYCWKTDERINDWIESGGLLGQKKKNKEELDKVEL